MLALTWAKPEIHLLVATMKIAEVLCNLYSTNDGALESHYLVAPRGEFRSKAIYSTCTCTYAGVLAQWKTNPVHKPRALAISRMWGR